VLTAYSMDVFPADAPEQHLEKEVYVAYGRGDCEEEVASLKASDQTIVSLNDPRYWEACCPWLACKRDTSSDTPSGGPHLPIMHIKQNTMEDCSAALRDRGYCRVQASQLVGGELGSYATLVDSLRRGVARVQDLGHEASAISVFDEAWALQASLCPALTAITGGLCMPTGDVYSFAVSADRPSGFNGPHRDKPTSGPDSFDTVSDLPHYVTAWVALTSATPESSCLYFVPKHDDSGYYEPGDALDQGGPPSCLAP
jgi:hypothetical protein